MQALLTAWQMREYEISQNHLGVSDKELMRRAAVQIADSWHFQDTAIVCGSGNNGGDGYALALELHDRPVRIYSVGAPKTNTAQFYKQKCTELGIPIAELTDDPTALSDKGTVVDCLLGTGYSAEKGAPRREIETAIDLINSSGRPVVSVDINSGLCADSGYVYSGVKSDLTVALGSYKPGHFLGSAPDLIGSLTVRKIGSETKAGDVFLSEISDFGQIYATRLRNSHKGTYGTVTVIGGCRKYPGAVKLASSATMKGGCGVCRVVVTDDIYDSIAPALLECTASPVAECKGDLLLSAAGGSDAVAVGPGWGRTDDRIEALEFLLENVQSALVLDGDALYALCHLKETLAGRRAPVLITPHPAEFARLAGVSVQEVLTAPLRLAKKFAADCKCIVLLKGSASIATDGKTSYIINRGSAGMATAGSGDVLTGLITGLCGYSDDILLNAACGAYTAGIAGELAASRYGDISMTSADTLNCIPEAVMQISNSCR